MDFNQNAEEGENSKENSTTDLNSHLKTDASKIKVLGKNPLEIFEILEIVLKQVDSYDLWNFRNVCKLWDEAVVRIITTTPARGFHLCCGEPSSYAICSWSRYIKTKRLKMESEALEEFNILLKESNRPQLLFKNVSLSSSIPEVENMLMKYGKYVKNLEVKGGNDTFHILNKCLGQNGYCPNVQVLKVESCTDQMLPLDRIEKLKLRNLTLKEVENCGTIFCMGVGALLDGILSKSTEITSLKIKNTKHHQSQTTRYCLELLQTALRITKNSKALYIKGDVYGNLEALCKVELTKNLKIVKLAHAFNLKLEISNEKKHQGLRKFVKLVGESLEAFHVDDDDENRQGDYFLLDVSDLPVMPRLKMTSYMTLMDPSENHDFLSNCPVLKMLRLKQIENFQTFLENYLEKKNPVCLTPGSLNYVPKSVHKHVEIIEVLDDKLEVSSPSTIYIMNAVFPNLTDFHCQLKLPNCSEYWVEGQQILFERFFQAITEMKNLKRLTIGFADWKYNELFGVLDLTQAFSNLKASPNLGELIFTSYDAENPNYTFLIQYLLALIGAPKLDRIWLCHFPVTEENKKMRWEAKNKFELNGIELQIGQTDEDDEEEEEN